MGKEATPPSAEDDDDWLRPYAEQGRGAAGGAKVIAFPSSLQNDHATRLRRRAVGALLAAAALGLVIAISAILIGYTRGPEPSATPDAAGAAQRRPAISPLDMTRERGANLPVEQWHSAF